MQDLGTLSPAIHYRTHLPENIVQQFVEEVDTQSFPYHDLEKAVLSDGREDTRVRNCQLTTFPTFHWFSGFLWHYIARANRESFLYDITCIENEAVSYIEYTQGNFYTWHMDHDINCMLGFNVKHNRNTNLAHEKAIINGEVVRKLSFTLQLSSPDDYEGGELQLLRQGSSLQAGKCSSMFTVPKELGLLTVFDSRIAHRVRKVKSGKRKSLVGWVMGPRWK
jgi:predicted 2-oxoglutarate/Fe(II)-dependent dioxygenase YbiX